NLRLLGHRRSRDGPAKAPRARREQDVPDERVDRGTADEPHAVEVLVQAGDDLEVDADDEDHRRLQDGLDQPPHRWRSLRGGRVDRGWIDGVPRVLAGLALSGVALRRRRGQGGQRLAGGAIPDDDDVPALPVAAARREPRPVEDVEQHVVGQRLVGALPRREGGPHRPVDLHDRDRDVPFVFCCLGPAGGDHLLCIRSGESRSVAHGSSFWLVPALYERRHQTLAQTRLRSTPRTEPAIMSLRAPIRATDRTMTVATSTATANRSGSACGAIPNRDTPRTPITAGPMPFITALVHASFLTRSSTGRTASMRMNEGRNAAAAATAAPATPATLQPT